MRTIILFIFCCIFCLNLHSQNITVKEIKELGTDFTASKFERKDNMGKSCAVIKIALPSIKGVSFSNHIGEVSNKAGEYIVYVSPGITSLCIFKDEEPICLVDFTKSNLDIQSKHTYRVTLQVEQTREMVFHILPADACLTVNGEVIALDEDGMGSIVCEPEKMYNYTIEAPDYITIEDAFMLDPEEDILEPINISLEHKMGTVTFNCNAREFEVIANNDSHGIIKSGKSIQLPYGKNTVRIVSDQYEDWTRDIYITDKNSAVTVEMEQANDVSKKLRSRTSLFLGGGFAFDFNKDINMNNKELRGYPIRAGLDVERFIKRWFTFRTGLEVNILTGKDLKINKKAPIALDIPFLFSLNIPLGKLNRHHFSIGLGPVIGGVYLDTDAQEQTDDEMGKTDKTESTTEENALDKFDIITGGRLEARFTLNHFILSGGLDYHYYIKQTIAKNGMLIPYVTIGYKF